MATTRKKSAKDIMEQGSRLNKILYHGGVGASARYKRVSEITNRYLDNIAKRNGYEGFVDQFRNNRDGGMMQSEAFNRKYSRASYSNGTT